MITNTTITMTSIEIATAMDKAHKNVLRDIRKMVEAIEKETGSTLSWSESTYKGGNGEERPMIVLSEDLVQTLVTGYKPALRHKVIKALHDVRSANTLEEAQSTATNILADICNTVREELRNNHKSICSVFGDHFETLNLKKEHTQSTLLNIACKATTGVSATVFKRTYGLQPRDYWVNMNDYQMLMEYDRNLARIETMVELGLSYDTIKEKLNVL